MTVTQADNTLIQIRKRVRRLTSSPNESSLSTDDIDQYINSFYTQDFIYAIKLDQLRSVQTLFTSPNIDRYPIDVNDNQGIRSPVYFQGVEGGLFKDRNQFFNLYPRFPTRSVPATGDGVEKTFTFTLNPIPFLSNDVTIGSVDTSGDVIKVKDDGGGNLVNVDDVTKNAGTIDYVTGVTVLDFNIMAVTPGAGEDITVWTAQYSASRPRNLLFWNNELTVRPVPDGVYEIEFETYLTPTAFMDTTDSPILNQWKDYISSGSAIKILEDRGDIEGVQMVTVLFEKQAGLALERQGVEEIGQRNQTIYSSTVQGYGNYGYSGGFI